MKQRYLPSKRIWILIVVILVGAVSLALYQNQSAVTSLFGSTTSTPEEIRSVGEDSDNDGLPDWREKLWDTDPNDPDTDGDGTKDGDEVAQNRDPLDDSENDYLGNTIPTSTSSSPTTNITAEMNAEIAPRVLILAAAQENGEDISEEDIDRITTAMADDVELNIEKYKKDDINTFKNPSDDELVAYIQQMQQIAENQVSLEKPGPIEIMARAMSENDYDQLEQLNGYINRVNRVTHDLINLEAPQGYSSNHLIIVNQFNTAATSLKQIQNMENDPMGAIMAMQKYRKADIGVRDAIRATSESIANQIESQN